MEVLMSTESSLINKDQKHTMLKKSKDILLAFSFFFVAFGFKAQVNYVQNPSFETLVGYDNSFPINYIWTAPPWDTISGGNGGGSVGVAISPSFVIFGETLYQVARSGNYMGSINYYNPFSSMYRGYMRNKLIKNLEPNKNYCITSYFNLPNRCQYGSDELSIYLENGSLSCISQNNVALANAQIKSPPGIFYIDTLNWMKVQGQYLAKGHETHLTIGNFKTQANSTATLFNLSAQYNGSDYFVDDVSVLEADLPAYAGRDTVLCTGDSVFIGRPPEIGLECIWKNNGSQIATGGGLWVKPATTQTFEVTQDVCGLIKKDTVRVQIKPKYTGGNISISVNSPTACPNNTLTLTINNPPPGPGNSYNWQPFSAFTQTGSIAKAVVSQNTTFSLTLSNNGQNAFCPLQRSNTVSVTVPLYTGIPVLIAPNYVCFTDTVKLSLQNVLPGNSITYQWQPKTAFTNTLQLPASAVIKQSTTFTLNISSTGNNSLCPYTYTVNALVEVPDTCINDPLVPNVFTPNNDEVNETWGLQFKNNALISDFVLNVYDRWGTLIYQSEKAGQRWDGRTTSGEPCSTGVYYYVATFKNRNESREFKGNISLLR